MRNKLFLLVLIPLIFLLNCTIQFHSAVPDPDYFEPRLIEGTPVEYPKEAKLRGIEGDVLARIYINEYGYVRAVEIEKSDHPLLDHAVYVAVKDWKFEPALQRGFPVRSEIVWSFPFYKPKIISYR